MNRTFGARLGMSCHRIGEGAVASSLGAARPELWELLFHKRPDLVVVAALVGLPLSDQLGGTAVPVFAITVDLCRSVTLHVPTLHVPGEWWGVGTRPPAIAR